ncbi:MAG: hypothetical protein Q7T56_01660 [Nocardioidaceae bacterium]|nr:hypothetical protein [Nocardioidaceae bacterium]
MRPSRTPVLVALLCGALVAVGSPASAQTRTFADARGDAPATVDVLRTKVTYTASSVRVVVRVRDLRRGASGEHYPSSVLIDTTTRRRGPEFAVSADENHTYFARMRSWRAVEDPSDPNGAQSCRFALRYDTRGNRITYTVPRACLGNPSRVRVTIGVYSTFASGSTASDLSPRKRAFHGWVRRG